MSEERDLRGDPRAAGNVMRYHTWPHLAPQTNAHHGWNCARILLAIWPMSSVGEIIEALFHDVGEITTGDAPYPVKKDNPVLAREMNRVEQQSRLGMALPWGLPTARVDDLAHQRLKIVDYLELYEWALHEMGLGNSYAVLVAQRGKAEVLRRSEVMPEDDRRSILRYLTARDDAHVVQTGRAAA